MKKIALFVAVLAIAGLTFTSCNKDVEKCWKVTVKASVGEQEIKQTTFVWATANQIEPMIEQTKEEFKKDLAGQKNVKISITKSAANKYETAGDCYDAAERADVL